MFTAQQYRTKVREYEVLLNSAHSPAEDTEYRDLQKSYASLADNLEWLAANGGKIVSAGAGGAPGSVPIDRHAEHAEQERILRCLGAAVILKWNSIPTKLQSALFEAASTVQGTQNAPLKHVLAQFLHDHKDDAERHQQRQNGG